MSVRIRRYVLSFIAVCSLMLLAFTMWGADIRRYVGKKAVFEPSDTYNSRACGPICLRIAAARLGMALDIEKLINECELTEKGTSLSRLKQVADMHGFQANGVRLTWPDLLKVNAPVIIFLNQSHFCCIDPRERDPTNSMQVRMYCPGMMSQWISKNDISSAWRGESLIIHREDKQVDANVPRLQFDTVLMDFGSIEPCDTLETRFPFKNTGRTPLIIGQIKKSCGCTSATVTKSVLNPGEKGEILVHIAAIGRAGYQKLSVYVESNDPLTSTTELQYTGVINQKLHVSKSVLDFGDVYPGQTITQDIEVTERDGKHNLRLEGADVKYEQITKPEHIPATECKYLPLTKIRENIIMTWPAKRTIESVDNTPIKYRVIIQVTIPRNEPYGPIKGRLEIATTRREIPDVRIPVTMNVVNDIYTIPAQINIGVLKPNEDSVKTFMIKRRSGKPVKIVKTEKEIASPESDISVDVKTKEEELDHATMEMTVHRSRGEMSNVIAKGNMKFLFDSGEELRCEWKGFFK